MLGQIHPLALWGQIAVLNVSRIAPTNLAGRILRLPLRFLRLLPSTTKVWIVQGPLRGWRWIVASAAHGCWLGTYELDKQKRLTRMVKPGDVFFDIGAHAGFFTLLAAKLVGETGKVFAFEPLPSNYNFLKQHVQINGIHNVVGFQAAVSDRSGTASFQEGHSSVTGRLSQGGTIPVEVLTLDELYAAGKIPLPDCVKIDVEGAEAAALKGARRVLTEGKPTISIETHGYEAHEECLGLLRSLGYDCESLRDEIIARKPS